jgi:hypothetical protein
MGPVPLAVTDAATIGPEVMLIQLYVVPPIVLVGIKFNVSPLHVCNERLAALFVITGTGLTVTSTSNGGPWQPFAEGVIV